MTQRERWFEDNRANWDDRAALHAASGYGIEELLGDPALVPHTVAQDAELLGELRGRDVIHLQCHLGTDTIGLSRLGARRLVGVDLSGESLRRAREVAARAGADIDFVQANVYDAREAVAGEFDLVYTSIGVLCWLPDIAAWGRVVASLLKPGGRFVIRDDHPMFLAVGDDVAEGLRVEQPYFQTALPLTWEDGGSYVAASDDAPPITHRRNHQWNHSLGQIVSALLAAGLVLDVLEESAHSAWCRWPELMVQDERGWRLREDPERMPLQFLIAAHRPFA